MTKSNQSSLDIADHLSRGEYDWCPDAETRLREQHDRIKVLELNHKIQLDIAKKQFAYIAELEKANVYAVNKLKECVDEKENNRHDIGISEAIGFEKGYQVGLRKAQEK